MGAHASFEQLSERRPGSVHLYDMAIVPGVNRLLSGLDLLPLDSITRLGSVKEDLARVVRAWNPSTTVPKFVREKSDAAPESDAVEGSPHLVRLWAFDRVKRLCSSGKKADTAEAVETALRYKLVTPVSGAVVLETKQQYQEAGLTPAERREAPAIPEPETVVLAIVAVIVLLGASWLRRRRMSVEAPGCM
jgi:hypothetical protein